MGSPTMIEMKDDFPVPLRPTRPTFSPAPTTKEASDTSIRSPISMVSDEATITPQCTGGEQALDTLRRCQHWNASGGP